MEGGYVNQEEKGGEGRTWGGPYRAWGGYVGDTLEEESTFPSRQEGGDQVNHVWGYVFGKEEGPELRRIQVVEAGLYFNEEG